MDSMNSSEFTCKCGKQKGWITVGQETKLPCPSCGRKYFGVYSSKKLIIKAVEVERVAERRQLLNVGNG